jgi:uncharacterized protein with NRDE domain
VCTLAIYFRMLPDWALLVAANRDEQYDRPSAPPGAWSRGPRLIAGRDLRAGGTWLGISEHGLLAAMLNRRINSDTATFPDARSRGQLCLDLLAHRSAADAEVFIRAHRTPYNPFTALVADRDTARVFYNLGKEILIERLEPGLHVFSSAAEFDLHSAKADRAYSLFGGLAEKLRRAGNKDFETLAALGPALGDHSLPPGSADAGDAICVHREATGTVSSSVVALTAARARFDTYFCPGPPCQNEFSGPVSLAVR